MAYNRILLSDKIKKAHVVSGVLGFVTNLRLDEKNSAKANKNI